MTGGGREQSSQSVELCSLARVNVPTRPTSTFFTRRVETHHTRQQKAKLGLREWGWPGWWSCYWSAHWRPWTRTSVISPTAPVKTPWLGVREIIKKKSSSPPPLSPMAWHHWHSPHSAPSTSRPTPLKSKLSWSWIIFQIFGLTRSYSQKLNMKGFCGHLRWIM